MTLEKRKHWLVEELYIYTADEDYLLARWCYFNDLHRQFFWHAAQAVEKYQKASLVLNGYSIKKYSHQLLTPYERIKSFAAEFLLAFKQPLENLIFSKNPDIWISETHEDFIKKIEKHGSTSNRYDYFGIYLDYGDLYKLDQLVFQLRNLAVNLNDVYDDAENSEHFNLKFAQILRKKPNSQLFPFEEKLINAKRYSKSLYDLARDNNYVFAKDYDHTVSGLKINSKVSRLEMLYADDYFSYARETRVWFKENFKLTNSDKARLEDINKRKHV